MTDIVPKETIEREARTAAAAGQSLKDSCPYPFGTPAADHFCAVYLLSVNQRPVSAS